MYKYCILQIIFMFSRENKWEGVGERERGGAESVKDSRFKFFGNYLRKCDSIITDIRLLSLTIIQRLIRVHQCLKF